MCIIFVTILLYVDISTPSSPVVVDEVVQTYKAKIAEQDSLIKSFEQKMKELETIVQSLVSNEQNSNKEKELIIQVDCGKQSIKKC